MKKITITSILIVCILISVSCTPMDEKKVDPLQPSATFQSTPTDLPTVIPTIQGPVTVDLISLDPIKKHGYVFAFGEDDLLRQQYGNFVHNGKDFPSSIFAPSPSVLEYQLAGKYETLKTTLYMMECDFSDADGAFFVIELDGKVAFRSPQLDYQSKPLDVKLDVSGIDNLRMEVYSTQNIGVDDPNVGCDASVWGDPYLIDNDPQPDLPVMESITPYELSDSVDPGSTMVTFYVAPTGNDANPGTQQQPFASIDHAKEVIRTINKDMTGPIQVFIRSGTYQISQAIDFTEEDSGTNGYDIIYQAFPGEIPVISGGVEFSGWETVADEQYWKMTIPDSVELFRNLYVNGKRATRAQTESVIAGVDFWKGEWSDRDGIIVGLDGPDWWISNWSDYPVSKMIMSPSELPSFSRPEDLELHWNYEWMDMRAPVEDVLPLENGQVAIELTQPYFSWSQNMKYIGWVNWPDPGGHEYEPSWDRPFYIENALELLDTPGEWYYNEDTRELFYFPREGETSSTSWATIPQEERLISILGGGVGHEVHNIQFNGLSFEYSSWMRASIYGTAGGFPEQWVDGESALFSAYAEIFTPPAIRVEHAKEISFLYNVFIHLGSVGLGLENNVYGTQIIGNAFMDISDAAITMGHGLANADLDEPDEALIHDILISNNLVHVIGVEYWSAHAIIGFFVHDVEVSHNFVQEIPNSGISLFASGFTNVSVNGIGNNSILFNRVDQSSLKGINGSPGFGGDAGAIYIGGNQVSSLIEGNYLSNVVNHYTCIYLDLANNDNMTIQKNVCENSPMWLSGIGAKNLLAQDNFTDTNVSLDFYTPTIITSELPYIDEENNNRIINTIYTPDRNWSAEALAIMKDSGLEQEYKYLLDLIKE